MSIDVNAARKEQAALWSIVASLVLTIGKFVAAWMTGSLALFSEAGHGLIDVAATTLTYLAVRAAAKPADAEHHYGHGKLEAVAALIETGLLFVLAGYVVFEGITRLFGPPHPVEANAIAFAILVIAILVDAWRWRVLSKVAKETRSQALEADALHFSSDLVSSLLTLIGLGFVALGYLKADALAALGVAVFIAVAGWRLARRTLDTLLDAAPQGLAEQVRTLTSQVSGVVEVEEVRVRPLGGAIAAEVTVAVARTLPLDRVQAIKTQIGQSISAQIADADISIRINPRALDDETILERVMLIAARRRSPVHHVTVQDIAGRLSISLDMEIDGRMSLSAAHGLAHKFETALKDELGPQIEVEIHIEPLRARHLDGQDTPAPIQEALADALRHASDGPVRDIHNVRVRQTQEGLIVNYHCRCEGNLPIAEVHAHVDALERRVRVSNPDIFRIVGHAEPA